MVDTDCKTNYTTIPFQQTGYFSKTICDYLDRKETIAPFYNNYPDLDGFKKQIEEKRKSVEASSKRSQKSSSRSVLVAALEKQYEDLNTSDKVKVNIKLLQEENTFTVTTGHQLNLFTGPLYFLYKIISTINLAKQLKAKFPKENFVPIYWMATEDHDFDEINYFNFKGKKIRWDREDGGGVGRFSTEGLGDIFEAFTKQLGNTEHAEYLKDLFRKGYLENETLAEATRCIANELFGSYGLVILDGDDKTLKQLFIPFIEDELIHQTSYVKVSSTIADLEKSYKVQVNPREINLFYLNDQIRERILFEDEVFKVKNTTLSWTKTELLKELTEFPERFSPNVIMRPLYQEVILPNLCYIGGGGELAYWLELKAYFEAVKVPFPILLLRNSVLVVSEKQRQKLNKLQISNEEVFLKQQELIHKKINEISELDIDFSPQKELLKKQFAELEILAEQTDKSFIGAVKAQTKKQLNGLDMLEKRLLKAEKRKHQDLTDRIKVLQDELFPNQSLEERQQNFSEYYLQYGDDLIQKLVQNLDPLKGEFSILTLA